MLDVKNNCQFILKEQVLKHISISGGCAVVFKPKLVKRLDCEDLHVVPSGDACKDRLDVVTTAWEDFVFIKDKLPFFEMRGLGSESAFPQTNGSHLL